MNPKLKIILSRASLCCAFIAFPALGKLSIAIPFLILGVIISLIPPAWTPPKINAKERILLILIFIALMAACQLSIDYFNIAKSDQHYFGFVFVIFYIYIFIRDLKYIDTQRKVEQVAAANP